MPSAHHMAARLDAISPAALPARGAAGLRAIRAAAKNLEAAHDELRTAVRAAHADGDSWKILDATLGIFRWADQQRVGD